MNDNLLKTLTKVFGVLFIIFGLLTGFTAAVVLFGTGVVGYADMMAQRIGESVGTYPYSYALLGVALITVLSIVYLAGGWALLKMKPWAIQAVAAVGFIGIILNLINIATGVPIQYFELFWSIVYLGFAYIMHTKQHLFKK